MARTNLERLQEVMLYLHRDVSSDLAVAVDAAARQNPLSNDQLGAAVSLQGYSFGLFGSARQHLALRSLLLCQKLFLNAPFAVNAQGVGYSYHVYPDLPKTAYRRSTEAQIVQALRCYLKDPTATRDRLADAAAAASPPGGNLTWETLTRDIDPFPSMLVCFDAVRMWLFKAGFVSIRWLSSFGPGLNAATANDILGRGSVIDRAALARIPRGHLFNFHKADREDVCHWGISLGGGIGAAANTTSDWLGAPRAVQFQSGNTHYGIFPMDQSYEVCRYKYSTTPRAATDVTIRQIDPAAAVRYF